MESPEAGQVTHSRRGVRRGPTEPLSPDLQPDGRFDSRGRVSLRGTRILFVGYGFLPQGPGGAAAVQAELVEAARDAGAVVGIYQGGVFSPWGGPRVATRRTRGGIRLFELINSPNRPGVADPRSEVENGRVTVLDEQVVEQFRPQLAHVNELTFHCAATVRVLRRANVPCIKTIHNYLDVCPQRDLLFCGRERCDDFEEGGRCVRCSPTWRLRPWLVFAERTLSDTLLYRPAQALWRTIKGSRPAHLSGVPSKGRSSRNLAAGLSQAFALRRREFVSQLNSMAAVHVYSRRSGEILQRYGVCPSLIRHVPVTTRTVEAITPKPSGTPGRPLVFGYRGGIAPNKGVDVLIAAFKRLAGLHCRLVIYGSGSPDYVALLKTLASGTETEFMGPYDPMRVSEINARIDVGIVPSIWEELFGLVGLEFVKSRVPLVVTTVGAMKEYVQEGCNGFLVAPGDPEALAEAMRRFAEDPALVTRMQGMAPGVPPLSGFRESVADLYREAIGCAP